MHLVDELFVGDEFYMTVRIAEKAKKELAKYVRRGQGTRFLKKLKRYATVGFPEYEGDKNPIRHEWDGVWRIADSSLFRLIGFYEGTGKESFIVIDAFTKSGKSLSVAQRRRIDEVARVKREGLWKRRVP